MMKNIFIFLEDKMSIKFFMIKLFILYVIFLPKSLYALSGKEINNHIKKWLESENIKSNPQLQPDMVTITCRQGRIQEARICLSKTLQPVPCGRDVVSDCKLKNALLDPVR